MGSPEDEPGRTGDEGPRHRVLITKGFWLFDTPCTQTLWQTVMGNNPSQFVSSTRPVERICWLDSQEFIRSLNQRITGLKLALPTSAQWEYACRAQSQAAYYFGANPAILGDYAWYEENAGEETRPVGQKLPNSWGLFDMHGSVWEWCLDGIRTYRHCDETDPLGPQETTAERALRGGAWFNDAEDVRSACQSCEDTDIRRDGFGFRCAHPVF